MVHLLELGADAFNPYLKLAILRILSAFRVIIYEAENRYVFAIFNMEFKNFIFFM
jgi:hypothetical protein